MPTQNFVRLFFRAWKLILLCTVLGAVVALAASLAQTWRYSSTERILITQTNATGLDPYTAIKSTERIAENLSQIIYTSSFFNAVMAKGQVDAKYFPTDEIDKRKKWQEAIETKVVPNTGVVSITAYHPVRDQATNLAVGVAQELATVTPDYFGYSVRVQIIDDPLPSRFIAKPDFLRNIAIGAIVGLLLSAAWVLGRVKSVT
ncbi:MAG: Wzz/FepE/Etk N-terminal domain-containing protein [Patescibacteria group bacterium]